MDKLPGQRDSGTEPVFLRVTRGPLPDKARARVSDSAAWGGGGSRICIAKNVPGDSEVALSPHFRTAVEQAADMHEVAKWGGVGAHCAGEGEAYCWGDRPSDFHLIFYFHTLHEG